MLFTELSTGFVIFSGLLTILAIFCVVWLLKLANYCRDAVDWVQNNNQRSLSLLQITELQTTMSELLDSHQSLLDSHKKLRSRIGMRELRERRASEGEPTDLQSPDKRAVRLAAKSAGLLK